VRVGQVISYQVPVGAHQVETHRVVRILRGGAHPVVQTKGDANNRRDPWTARLEGRTAWRLALVVPYGGYVVNALRSPRLHVATTSGGPYTPIAMVAIGTTSYLDADPTLAYSTTYHYVVQATYHSWTATSTQTAVTTLSSRCA